MKKTLDTDEDLLLQKNIKVFNKSLPSERKSMCCCLDGGVVKAIIYDSSNLESAIDKRTVILHEEIHLDNPDTMYSINDPRSVVEVKEQQADVLCFKKHIPLDLLFKLLYEEHLQLHEISNRLMLSEELIKKAYNYYSSLEEWIKRISNYEL